MTGIVYFIKEKDRPRVKIGYSSNSNTLVKRIRLFQTGNSDDLHIFAVIKGTEKYEKSLHKKFSNSKRRGEWFELDHHLVTFIHSKVDERFVKSLINEDQRLKDYFNGVIKTKKRTYNKLTAEKVKRCSQVVQECIRQFGFFHKDLVSYNGSPITSHYFNVNSVISPESFGISYSQFMKNVNVVLNELTEHKRRLIVDSKDYYRTRIYIYGNQDRARMVTKS